MFVRSCRVTIQDMNGVSHTVKVTAATLYEAISQGLTAICGNRIARMVVRRFVILPSCFICNTRNLSYKGHQGLADAFKMTLPVVGF